MTFGRIGYWSVIVLTGAVGMAVLAGPTPLVELVIGVSALVACVALILQK